MFSSIPPSNPASQRALGGYFSRFHLPPVRAQQEPSQSCAARRSCVAMWSRPLCYRIQECGLNPGCRGLLGDCCPASTGDFLACCGMPPVATPLVATPLVATPPVATPPPQARRRPQSHRVALATSAGLTGAKLVLAIVVSQLVSHAKLTPALPGLHRRPPGVTDSLVQRHRRQCRSVLDSQRSGRGLRILGAQSKLRCCRRSRVLKQSRRLIILQVSSKALSNILSQKTEPLDTLEAADFEVFVAMLGF